MYALYLSPVGYDVGLTSVALGLVRALERRGLKVGFVKPVAQQREGWQAILNNFARYAAGA